MSYSPKPPQLFTTKGDATSVSTLFDISLGADEQKCSSGVAGMFSVCLSAIAPSADAGTSIDNYLSVGLSQSSAMALKVGTQTEATGVVLATGVQFADRTNTEVQEKLVGTGVTAANDFVETTLETAEIAPADHICLSGVDAPTSAMKRRYID